MRRPFCRPAAANTAGTYTVTIGGGAGTTGTYAMQLILNAALENESHGGPSNDTLLTAQDIDGSFIDLGIGTARHGAVLGRVPTWWRELSTGM